MSLCYINVETIRKYENVKKIYLEKKYTSPANEFLLYKCRNNRKIQKCDIFSSNLVKFTCPAD